jgi:hypothetical protein
VRPVEALIRHVKQQALEKCLHIEALPRFEGGALADVRWADYRRYEFTPEAWAGRNGCQVDRVDMGDRHGRFRYAYRLTIRR